MLAENYCKRLKKILAICDSEIKTITNTAKPLRLYGMEHFGWPEFLAELSYPPFVLTGEKSGLSTFGRLESGFADVVCSYDVFLDPHQREEGQRLGIRALPLYDIELGFLCSVDNSLAQEKKLSLDDLEKATFLVPDGAYLAELEGFYTAVLKPRQKLNFIFTSIGDSISNLQYLDLGSSVLIYERRGLESIVKFRKDLVVLDQLSGESLRIPIALFWKENNSSPLIEPFVAQAVDYYSEASLFSKLEIFDDEKGVKYWPS